MKTERTDADFLRELLTDWKQPFDDHEVGRRTAVAKLVFDKQEQIVELHGRIAVIHLRLISIFKNCEKSFSPSLILGELQDIKDSLEQK